MRDIGMLARREQDAVLQVFEDETAGLRTPVGPDVWHGIVLLEDCETDGNV
jgi:hypothetical protein